LFNEKQLKGLNCNECDKIQQQIRHCYGVDWKGRTTYIINTSQGQELLKECPKSFVQRHYFDFQIFLDCFFAVEKHIPIANVPFFELPNRIVRYLEIIYEEQDFVNKQRLKKG